MGSMLMNMAANLLGLGNAATPLGLRAMKDLESLNPRPGTATNAMCTFLAVNTSGIQLVPVTAIAILAANKSANPTVIMGTALICSAAAAVAGVLMAKLLSRLPLFRVTENDLQPGGIPGRAVQATAAETVVAQPAPTAGPAEPAVREASTLQPLLWWGRVIMAAYFAFFGFLFLQLILPAAFGGSVMADDATRNLFVRSVNAVSLLSIPFLLSAIPLFAALRRVKIYEEFVDGAKEGFQVAIRIIPYLVAILVAMGMFRAAGGIEWLSRALSPVLSRVGFPTDLLPMVLVRPLSGNASLGFFTELVRQFGPDSLVARTAGTIYGSTETTFYVLAVYFGSVAVTRTRHALLAGLTADFVSVAMAIVVCRAVFG
jgi:spore maturation protein SpmB